MISRFALQNRNERVTVSMRLFHAAKTNKDKHSNSAKNKKPRTFVGTLFSLNGNYFLFI